MFSTNLNNSTCNRWWCPPPPLTCYDRITTLNLAWLNFCFWNLFARSRHVCVLVYTSKAASSLVCVILHSFRVENIRRFPHMACWAVSMFVSLCYMQVFIDFNVWYSKAFSFGWWTLVTVSMLKPCHKSCTSPRVNSLPRLARVHIVTYL